MLPKRFSTIERLNNRTLVFFYLFIGLFVYWIILVPKTYAQTAPNTLDITISPTSFDFINNPGTTVQSRFRLRNNLDQPLSFTISVGKLLPDNHYGEVSPADVNPKDDFIHWIHFNQASVSARPKEWTDVPFSLTIPKTAAFGYYYAIRIRQTGVDQTKGVGSKIIGEVLIPILLEVNSPGAIAQGHIIAFTPQASINEYLPVNFTSTVGNAGNVHITPRGNIFISGDGQQDIAVLDVNDAQGSILPGGKRQFFSTWDDGFFVMEPVTEDGVVKLDKNHKPVMHLVINWNKLTSFRIGKYTAHLLLVYDNGQRDISLEAFTTFWVIPYKIIGTILLAVIILIILVRLLLRWYVKSQIRKYQTKM